MSCGFCTRNIFSHTSLADFYSSSLLTWNYLLITFPTPVLGSVVWLSSRHFPGYIFYLSPSLVWLVASTSSKSFALTFWSLFKSHFKEVVPSDELWSVLKSVLWKSFHLYPSECTSLNKLVKILAISTLCSWYRAKTASIFDLIL